MARIPTKTKTYPLPPLPRVIVVDARHSSRFKVVEELRLTKLFDEVITPFSLGDAKEQLKLFKFDAGIIGPTLSDRGAIDFLSNPKLLSAQTGVIAIVSPAQTRQAILQTGVVRDILPISRLRKELLPALVRAVIASNPKSTWKPLATEYGLLADFDEEVESPAQNVSQSVVEELLALSITSLREVLAKLRSKEFKLDANGELTPPTSEAIETLVTTVVDGLIGKKAFAFGAFPLDFRPKLSNAFTEWVKDVIHKGANEATSRLKQELIEISRI